MKPRSLEVATAAVPFGRMVIWTVGADSLAVIVTADRGTSSSRG